MDRDNTIARLENIAKHAVHTAGEDTFILSLDDGLAIHEAIEALKAQLFQQGTTSDLISRQAAIDAIVQCTNCGDEDTLREYVLKHSLDNGWTGGILEALDAVKDLPTAQPEPQEGEWVQISAQRYFMSASYFYRCSACGVNNVRNTNFCPNCGAKMKGERQK